LLFSIFTSRNILHYQRKAEKYFLFNDKISNFINIYGFQNIKEIPIDISENFKYVYNFLLNIYNNKNTELPQKN
jgi:hypothetical protein